MLRVLAVFFDGLEMIVTGAESKDAQTRPDGASVPSGVSEGGGGFALCMDFTKDHRSKEH